MKMEFIIHRNSKHDYDHPYLKLGFIAIIATLPFQKTPEMFGWDWSGFGQTDEFSALLGIFIVCFYALIFGRLRVPHVFNAIISFIVIYALITIFDGIAFIRGAFGLFDAIKMFLPAIIAYAFVWNERDLAHLIKSITIIASGLSIIGIIFGGIAEITHSITPLLGADIRFFGLHRLVSLTGSGNWNYFGVYLVLAFFLVPIWESRHMRVMLRCLIIVALAWTQSRQALLGFMLMSFALFPVKQKISGFIIGMALISIVVFMSWDEISKYALQDMSLNPERYFRLYAFIALWKDFSTHIWIGSGPTTAGSLGSIIFNSHFYDNWPAYFHDMAFSTHGVDQYWMAILAEIGILGTAVYLYVFIVFRAEVIKSWKSVIDIEHMRKWRYIGKVLSAFMMALIVMGLAGGLNSAFVVWSYFGLAGAYLSFVNALNVSKIEYRLGKEPGAIAT